MDNEPTTVRKLRSTIGKLLSKIRGHKRRIRELEGEVIAMTTAANRWLSTLERSESQRRLEAGQVALHVRITELQEAYASKCRDEALYWKTRCLKADEELVAIRLGFLEAYRIT